MSQGVSASLVRPVSHRTALTSQASLSTFLGMWRLPSPDMIV